MIHMKVFLFYCINVSQLYLLFFFTIAKVVYAKFPEDIAQRKVLLMYPIMSKY